MKNFEDCPHCGTLSPDSEFCPECRKTIAAAGRCLKPDGVFALLYSHGSLRGWEAVARAYQASGLVITSIEPLGIERRQRPRAMRSEAINTCVVLVARRLPEPKEAESLDTIAGRLEAIARDLGRSLAAAGWRREDIGMAAFSQGVAMLANAGRVLGCDGDLPALRHLAQLVSRMFPAFKVAARKSL